MRCATDSHCIATLGGQPFALDYIIGYPGASGRANIPGFGTGMGAEDEDGYLRRELRVSPAPACPHRVRDHQRLPGKGRRSLPAQS